MSGKLSTAEDAKDAEAIVDLSSQRPPRPPRWRARICVIALFAFLAPLHAQDKGPIVFVGSSIFHRWTTLERQMDPLPVANIAFDGAQTEDWNRLIDMRVIPLKPRVIAYYCGSNDIDAG